MSNSFNLLLDIPEFIHLLDPYLDQGDVSSLARTCRKMYRYWTPSVYRSLEVVYGHNFKLFCSTPALLALARNIHYTRKVKFGVDELRYYYNCVLDFEEVHSRTIDTPRSRPSWLPPSDIRTYEVVALPPMSCLSRLHLNLGPSRKRLYSVSSIENPRTRLAQICWLVSLNPGLVELYLDGIPLQNSRDGRRFGEVIAGLNRLKKLRVMVHCKNEDDDWVELWSYIFFSCPPAVQQLSMRFEDIQNYSSIYQSSLGAGNDNEDEEEDEEELMVTGADPYVRRQGPLSSLEDLCFQPMDGFYWNSLDDVSLMFTHCPNIKKLNTYLPADDETIETMGEFLAKTCPRIENLAYGSFECERHDAEAYIVLVSLPAQQVTKVEFKGCPIEIIDPAFDTAIQHHSTTLREICIQTCSIPSSFSASTILKECRNLEVLFVQYDHNDGFYTTLDDTLKSPWGCIKLKKLTIAISDCELPMEPGVPPYYARQAPITLSETETRHFSRLEDLYKRIGTLTSMEDQDLTMATTRDDDDWRQEILRDPTSFPAFLSNGDTFTGRPGFLHHLSGLKNLKSLQGSVTAETEECAVTMGWPEVVWMDQAWPSLHFADFFSKEKNVTAPFAWLQNRRQNGRVGLRKLDTYIKMMDEGIKVMGQFIAKSCPRIEPMKYGSSDGGKYDAEACRIITALPVQ
ncbi:hypothetical protein BGZ91_004280 [Linnemannia elongata]|nr:hypothetical protein BGZ91_004280 [Linnemannia elongata]